MRALLLVAMAIAAAAACGRDRGRDSDAVRIRYTGGWSLQDYSVWVADRHGGAVFVSDGWGAAPVVSIDLRTGSASSLEGVLVPSDYAVLRDGSRLRDLATMQVVDAPLEVGESEYVTGDGAGRLARASGGFQRPCKIEVWHRAVLAWHVLEDAECGGLYFPADGKSLVVIVGQEVRSYSTDDFQIRWRQPLPKHVSSMRNMAYVLRAADDSEFWLSDAAAKSLASLRFDVATGRVVADERQVPSSSLGEVSRVTGLVDGGRAWVATIIRFRGGHMTPGGPRWSCELSDTRKDAAMEEARLRLAHRLFGTERDCKTRIIVPIRDGRILQIIQHEGELEVRRWSSPLGA